MIVELMRHGGIVFRVELHGDTWDGEFNLAEREMRAGVRTDDEIIADLMSAIGGPSVYNFFEVPDESLDY